MEDIKNSSSASLGVQSSASLGVQSSASLINCSSSEAETRTGCIYEPLAPLGVQTSAETVRRAKPRRESDVYTHPSARREHKKWKNVRMEKLRKGRMKLEIENVYK